MSRWISRAGRGSFPALALLCTALLLASCEVKKVPNVPDDGIEGEPSASQLIVYPDTPNRIYTYDDTLQPGPNPEPDPEDRLLSVEEIYATGPGAVQGFIFDFTPAERFEIFRREGSRFRLLKDFNLYPVKKVVQGQTDVFRFTDPRPGPPGAREYLARGVVDGVVTTRSPKTNVGRVTIGAVSPLLDYTAPTGIPPDYRPMSDSLLYMEWAPFPGAVGYWVHVYKYTDQGGEEIIASTVPAPMYVGVTRDYFLAYLPASVTAYQIGDPVPPGGLIVKEPVDRSPWDLLNGDLYIVRVSAVDADGQLIAYTGNEKSSDVIFRSEETYRRFSLGGALVQPRPCEEPDDPDDDPSIPPCCGTPPRPPCPPPSAATNPYLRIYPAGALPRLTR